jgi:hypothetical protein
MTLTMYLMNIALVELVVLQIRGHKITRARLALPVVMAGYAATQFLHTIPTAGNDLVLETTLALAGCALSVAAGLTTRVTRLGQGAVAKAGAVAGVLWVLGIGARMAFSLWVSHGGAPAVARFSVLHHITTWPAWPVSAPCCGGSATSSSGA